MHYNLYTIIYNCNVVGAIVLVFCSGVQFAVGIV